MIQMRIGIEIELDRLWNVAVVLESRIKGRGLLLLPRKNKKRK